MVSSLSPVLPRCGTTPAVGRRCIPGPDPAPKTSIKFGQWGDRQQERIEATKDLIAVSNAGHAHVIDLLNTLSNESIPYRDRFKNFPPSLQQNPQDAEKLLEDLLLLRIASAENEKKVDDIEYSVGAAKHYVPSDKIIRGLIQMRAFFNSPVRPHYEERKYRGALLGQDTLVNQIFQTNILNVP